MHMLTIQLLPYVQGRQPRLEALATVVAHLFLREPLHASRVVTVRQAAAGRSPSIVVLPPMPDECAAAVAEYNTQVCGWACVAPLN